MKLLQTTILSAILTGGLMAAPAIASQAPYSAASVQADQVVLFTSGGIGKTDQERLQQSEGQYSLKLTNALESGHYLAEVGIVIQDAKGQTLVNTITDGPLFYADLKPGTYKVQASYGGGVKHETITIGKADALRSITLHWNTGELADG